MSHKNDGHQKEMEWHLILRENNCQLSFYIHINNVQILKDIKRMLYMTINLTNIGIKQKSLLKKKKTLNQTESRSVRTLNNFIPVKIFVLLLYAFTHTHTHTHSLQNQIFFVVNSSKYLRKQHLSLSENMIKGNML